MEGQPDDTDEFVWAEDLVRYIRQKYGDYFCIGVAGYPEGHSDESNPAYQDPKHDMPYLVNKVKAGADFIMTQLFYDTGKFLEYENMVAEWDGGVLEDTIIIPGMMPIQSFQVLRRTAKLSHASIPQSVMDRLEQVKGDDEKVKKIGVEIVSGMIRKIEAAPSRHRRGFHFFTLNLEKAVSFILERCSLIPSTTPELEVASVIDDSELFTVVPKSSRPSHRRRSSAHNQINDGHSSNGTLEAPPSPKTTLAISHGVGSLGREATWDDFPNGRFGDARSPAFGEIDGYGPSLHMTPAAARLKWGQPTSAADISALFLAHIQGRLDQLPWSEGPLNAETRVIEHQLSRLIERGWWSIASQPAADSKPSADPVFGWGPAGGYVFQKAFVELWIPKHDWTHRLHPHLERPPVASQVTWHACACPARDPWALRPAGPPPPVTESWAASSSPADAAVNTVTWGMFPGKEIVAPTIIEQVSFRAWADEAYGIWSEWERCYPAASPSRYFIRACREQYLLVNVISHAFKVQNALWDILLAA